MSASRFAGRALLIAFSLSLAAPVKAEAWFDAGDSALRSDVQYLVDSGVIDVVLTSWPIPSADIAWALENVKAREHLSAGQRAAIGRLQRRLSVFRRDAFRISGHVSGAANPIELRTFENTPREEAEIGGTVSDAGERFAGRLAVQWVHDPDDDKSIRLDGSYGSMRLGNWLLTLGALDRWWGPGWDGSLLLSNNARPVPAVALDRESSRPFESKWLSWIGPWRFSTFMLKNGDRLLVPKQSQEVSVIGEVPNATSHRYTTDQSREDYIRLSGGYTKQADESRVYVVRANGSVIADSGNRWFSKAGSEGIEPGDTVVVPLNAGKMRPLPLWTAVTTIIYNLAVAVAAVNSF